MSKIISRKPHRRAVVKGGLAFAAAGMVGIPAIVRAAETIKIGILQPLSGGLEALGEQGFQGAVLAIDEANEGGGLLNRKIEGLRTDDKTDPKTAVEKTVELIGTRPCGCHHWPGHQRLARRDEAEHRALQDAAALCHRL